MSKFSIIMNVVINILLIVSITLYISVLFRVLFALHTNRVNYNNMDTVINVLLKLPSQRTRREVEIINIWNQLFLNISTN